MADDGSIKAGLRVLFEPVEAYFKTFGDTLSPEVLADSLSSGRMTPAILVRFMLGSVVLGSLIETVLPTTNPLPFGTMPIVSDALMLMLWLAANAAVAALVHLPLVRLGRQAPFRLAVMAAMFISAMFYPFFALADGVYFRVTGNNVPPQAIGLAFVWLAQSLARLYRTTPGKAGGLLVGASILIVAVAIAASGAFGYSPFGPTAYTAESVTPVLRQLILDDWATKPRFKGATIDALSVAPTEVKNTYRGQLEMTSGALKDTLDIEVVVDGDIFRWRLTSRGK